MLAPALLSLSVGIVALVFWREGFDIALGVLVVTFATSSFIGGVSAILSVRRSARRVDLQAEFVANVTHELRTPLAGIRLVAETLEAGRGDDPERLHALTEMLSDEVRTLEDLVERVLSWRPFEMGPLGAGPCDRLAFGEMVRDVVAATARLPVARDVTFEVVVASDLPAVLGDRGPIWHAIANLVHNAAKFGGTAGPVRVRVSERDDRVYLEVADQGVGIAPHDLTRVFQRFYRGSSGAGAGGYGSGGTGLGLAIVKSVIEAHGGEVTVESVLGHGAVFTAFLPSGSGRGERLNA